LIDDDMSEMGSQRREWVRGDLGMRVRDARDQGRLARIWESYQSPVCQELQFDIQPSFLAVRTLVGAARRLVRGGGEPRVAASAPSAMRRHELVAGMLEIGQHFQ